MHQTIFGETHKVVVHDRKEIKDFIESIKEEYSNTLLKNCLYQDKKLVAGRSINFLNYRSNNMLSCELKFLIRNAYDE